MGKRLYFFLKVSKQSGLTVLIFTLLIVNTFHAQVFWSEDFETDGNGSRYTPEVEVLPSATDASCNDHFARNLPTDTNGCSGDLIDTNLGTYTGLNGSFLWAGEDLDDNGVGGSQNFELFITFDNIPSIAGKSNLAFRGRFGAGATDQFDNVTAAANNPDFMIIEYQIDGGGYKEILAFHAKNPFGTPGLFNGSLALDTDGDQVGDGMDLDNELRTFTAQITETGTTLDLRIRVSANSQNEEIAFDFFELLEDFIVPVELISFDGKANQNHIQLHWRTASEINNQGFEIQKSLNAKDWKVIGFVEGQGNSLEINDYYFEDETTIAGRVNYYRLKQMDFDEAFEYSEVLAIYSRKGANDLKIFPNPSDQTFYISFDNPHRQLAQVRVFNQLGVQVLEQAFFSDAKQFEVMLSQAGTYIVQVQIGSEVSHHKLVIKI